MPMIDRSLCIELPTQLGQKQSEVFLVGWPLDVAFHSSLDRKLPVDVDSIEEARPLSNENIDGRLGELPPARVAERSVGELS